ncbi:MAG: hypothetical protein AAF449_11135, partial [Myxococcota bacterium]
MARHGKSIRLSLGLTVGLIATGCANQTKLYPAAGANLVKQEDGQTVGARVESAGIEVEVRPNAWVGVPTRLRRVTPLLITIENKNEDRIRLRYEEFVLMASDGRTFKALPPFHIRGAQSELDPFGFPAGGWLVPPYRFGAFPWYQFGPGFYPYGGGVFAPGLIAPYWGANVRQHRLPTGDMIAKALPESHRRRRDDRLRLPQYAGALGERDGRGRRTVAHGCGRTARCYVLRATHGRVHNSRLEVPAPHRAQRLGLLETHG